MTRVFKREEADEYAKKFRFDRIVLRELLTESLALLVKYGDNEWARIFESLLEQLSQCETFEQNKEFAGRMTRYYGNLGITDIYFRNVNGTVIVDDSEQFSHLIGAIYRIVDPLLTPWLYLKDVEEL